jgi:hypothetical protein
MGRKEVIEVPAVQPNAELEEGEFEDELFEGLDSMSEE